MAETLIDDRWELHELLGVGGGGRVWRTVDRLSGREAALKLVRATSTAHLARVRREISALQSLRIPGVVHLLEFGDHLGEPHLVMELVRGRPFPGAEGRLSWEELREPALRLVDVLARVHATGIIHRDLKPANVLVDDKGRVVLLDFGLARGTPGDEVVTRDGAMIGTPRYLAPEQVVGRKVDHRADLFALGIMLYDALAGSTAFDSVSLATRLTTPHEVIVPPLEQVAPEVPAAVARVVQALLAPMPTERPSSALEVRRALLAVGGGPVERREPLPLVAFGPLLDDVTARCLAGQDVAVAGAPGSGRTRFAEALAERLRRAGRAAVITRAGSRPLTSLRTLVDEELMVRGPAAVEDALRARLADGTVVIVDAVDQLDPWSRRVTERLAQAGQFVLLGAPSAPLALPSIPAADMRAWFVGPDIFFHLREDAARTLHQRTGGHAGRAARELDAWAFAELARREGARYHIDRDAIEQLEGGRPLGDDAPPDTRHVQDPGVEDVLAWMVLGGAVSPEQLAQVMDRPDWEIEVGLGELERAGLAAPDPDGRWRARVCPAELLAWPEERVVAAHRSLADVWPAESPERLRQLLAAGDLPRALDCATEHALAALGTGRTGRAFGVLAPILNRMREPSAAASTDRAVGLLVRSALAERSASTLHAARHLLERLPTAAAAQALRLLAAFEAMTRGQLTEADEEARATPPFADPELEALRHSFLVQAAVRRGGDGPALALEEAREALGGARADRQATWRGLWLYERGEYAAAAAAHAAAAAAAKDPLARLIPLVNLAAAQQDAFQFAEARSAAAEAEALAERLRVPVIEAMALGLRAQADRRLGRPVEISAEVLAASRVAGQDPRHSGLCLLAAEAAWRRGDLAAAAPLAEEAAASMRVRRPEAAPLALAFAAACGAPVDPEEVLAALPATHRRHRAQACALLALVLPERRDELRRLADLAAVDAPRDVLLEVLSLAECERLLDGGRL